VTACTDCEAALRQARADGFDVRAVVLDVAGAPTFADPQAVVMWTQGVTMSVKSDVSMKTLIGKGSGETFQMGFSGQGWVMVQPSEGVAGGSGQKSGMGF